MISFFSRILDLIAPRACASCGGRLAIDEELLCASCNMKMPRTDYYLTPDDNEMCRLFWARLNISRAAALFFYQPESTESSMIHALKYYNKPDIGYQLGRMAAREWMKSGFFDGIDVIIPVPLNRKRQTRRGYNQSMEIARGVSDVVSIGIADKAIKRAKATESQTVMNPLQRHDNVKGAFSLRHPELVAGKHVLIVDDIVTTGATISACGEELMKAGGVTISILSLGYTKG